MNLGPSWALERSRFTQGRETPPQGTPWWPSCLRGSCVAGEAVSGSGPPPRTEPLAGLGHTQGGEGRGEGTAGGGLLPRHAWTQPCRPLPEAPAVGETGRVSVREQPAQGPLTKAAGGAAPLRTHTEACHTEAGFRLLCCGEEATTPSLLGSAPCRVFWTRLSHTLSQFTGNYRDE